LTTDAYSSLIIPTVFTLFLCPKVLDVVFVHSATSSYIIGGADLMLPGVIGDSAGGFNEGELRAVAVLGNPTPFAVGVTGTAVRGNVEGRKGKAVLVVQTVGDLLWKECSHHLGGRIPSGIGESLVEVTQLPATLEAVEPAGGSDKEGSVDAPVECEGVLPCDGSGTCEPSNGIVPMSTDAILEFACMEAVGRLTKEDLPVPISTFLGASMPPCCPRGTKLDVKGSSYKQAIAFFRFMEEMEVIQLREESPGVHAIVGFSKQARFYREHRKMYHAQGDAPELAEELTDVDAEKEYGPVIKSITQLLRPHSGFKLMELLSKGDSLYTEGEVCAAVRAYIDKKGLLVASSGGKGKEPAVRIDIELAHLWGKSAPQELPVSKISEAFVAAMAPWHCIEFDGKREPVVRRGKPTPIEVHTEMRKGNILTRCVGLDSYGFNLERTTTHFRSLLSTSVSLAPASAGKAGKVFPPEIIAQGNMVKIVTNFLHLSHGFPLKVIDANEKPTRQQKR
jgi:translation initiation factor 2D